MICTNKSTLCKIIREAYLKMLIEEEKSLLEAAGGRPIQSPQYFQDQSAWEKVQGARHYGLDQDRGYFEDIGQDPEEMAVPEEEKPWLYGVETPDMESPDEWPERDRYNAEMTPEDEEAMWQRLKAASKMTHVPGGIRSE